MVPANLQRAHVRAAEYFTGPFKVLRAGYAKALTNPELDAEAKRRGLDAELIHGDELETLVKEVLSQPAEVIASMKKVMGG